MMTPRLCIRVDADSRVGTGHVMRCLAMAQEWKHRGGTCVFLSASLPDGIRERLYLEEMEVCSIDAQPGSSEDAAATLRLAARETEPLFLVVDGYHFSSGYQRAMYRKGQALRAGMTMLIIDDNGEQDHFYTDYILNYNIHAAQSLYPPALCESGTKLLLGSDFCLLRKAFIQQRNTLGRKTLAPEVTKILITLGGADPHNVTAGILSEIKKLHLQDIHIKVIVGGANQHYDTICHLAKEMTESIEIVHDADDTTMAAAMSWADIAVSAAGTTLWELCLFGTPALLLVIADNQQASAERALQRGLVCAVLEARDVVPEEFSTELKRMLADRKIRAACSQKMQETIHGNGSTQVIRHLVSGYIRLRSVTKKDCRQVWLLNNDPDVRKVSLQTADIPWEDHQNWYRRQMASPDSKMYLASDVFDTSVGLVRFQKSQQEAEISIVVAPEYRFLGYGTALIRRGAATCFLSDPEIDMLHAWIRPENKVSITAFTKAGFSDGKNLTKEGLECFRLSIPRHIVLKNTTATA